MTNEIDDDEYPLTLLSHVILLHQFPKIYKVKHKYVD